MKKERLGLQVCCLSFVLCTYCTVAGHRWYLRYSTVQCIAYMRNKQTKTKKTKKTLRCGCDCDILAWHFLCPCMTPSRPSRLVPALYQSSTSPQQPSSCSRASIPSYIHTSFSHVFTSKRYLALLLVASIAITFLLGII